MLLVTCVCSDDACTAEAEFYVGSVGEGERELCADCDCAVQVVAVSEVECLRIAAVTVAVPLALAA